MCTVCGCGKGETKIKGNGHSHDHKHTYGHHHPDEHTHDDGQGQAHAPGLSQVRRVQVSAVGGEGMGVWYQWVKANHQLASIGQ